MKFFKIGAFLLTGLIASNTSLAVDGYKDLKFGSSIEQVRKSKTCKTKWLDLKQHNAWGCKQFKFAKEATYGYAFFINNKLSRISIIVPQNNISGVLESLVEKYGTPSSKPTSLPSGPVPSSNWDIGFDNDTVIYRLSYNDRGQEQVFLMYTSPDFNQKMEEQNKIDIKDDL